MLLLIEEAMSTDEMVFLNVEKQIKNISYYFRSIDRKKLLYYSYSFG